jgi:hypothetical protein
MTRALVIKIFSILTGLTGAYALFVFFPGGSGCSDFYACLPYNLCGLFLLLIALPLFLLTNRARISMLYFSWFFFALFIYKSFIQITTDSTGQGLISIILIAPIFFICVTGIVLLPATASATST